MFGSVIQRVDVKPGSVSDAADYHATCRNGLVILSSHQFAGWKASLIERLEMLTSVEFSNADELLTEQ
jgi:hypothetical protein